MDSTSSRHFLWGLAVLVGIVLLVVFNGWPLYMLGVGLLDLLLVAAVVLAVRRWRRERIER